MSVLPRPSLSCDRAREWASLRLDGELSQLEGAMLASHVDRCAECRTVVAEIEAFTRSSATPRPCRSAGRSRSRAAMRQCAPPA